jgi:AcrR family transcriptional regulator
MARPKNPAHRDALLGAATRVFAAEGLGASTATIAKEAGVSAGTLFVYFETKPVLVNELYVTLKSEMGRIATAGFEPDQSPRTRVRLMWDNWIFWATTNPEKPRALAHLGVSDDVTAESHQAVGKAYAGIAELLRTIAAGGSMKSAPLGFVTALLSAIADATIDDLIQNPDPTGARSTLAFDALWRALAG